MPPLRDKSPHPGASSKSYGASELVELYRKVAEAQSLTVSAPLEMASGPSGRTLSLNRPQAIWAKITSGVGPSYGFTQQVRQSGGTWVDGPITGAAYEVNSASVPVNKIVRMQPGFAGEDWRFRYTKLGTVILAHVCVSVYNCDQTSALGVLVTITGPGGFSANCTTAGNVFVNSCCVGVPSTGTYSATVSGVTHTVNVTGSGTFTIPFFCLVVTSYTVCVLVQDCTLFPRPGVSVNFPGGGGAVITDGAGQACACVPGGGGTGTVVAPEAGYANLVFTIPAESACSNTSLGVQDIGTSLAPNYTCPGCVPGGTSQHDLHTPYQPPHHLTDSLCGPATLVTISPGVWISNTITCGNVKYELECNGLGQIDMIVTDGLHPFGYTFGSLGLWVQNPYAATFTGAGGRTISVSL